MDYLPLIAFLITLAMLFLALIKFKISPPIAMFCAAIVMGLLSGMKTSQVLSFISSGFGATMSSLGLVIAFGSIFGSALSASGATEEMAKGLLRSFGSKNDYLALNIAGYIISIPVYFGSAYIMLSPLLNSLQKLTKKRLASYCVSLFIGLLLTHCIVAPTPGPVAVAAQMGVNLGWFIIYGIIVSLPASLICGWLFAKVIDKKPSELTEAEKAEEAAEISELLNNKDLLAPDPTKPSAKLAVSLVVFPIVLIIVGAICEIALPADNIIAMTLVFLGNNNIALFLAAMVSLIVLRKYLIPEKGENVSKVFENSAGEIGLMMIVLGVGGSFGTIIGNSGLAELLIGMLSGLNMPVSILAFLLAMLFRAAVGSGTVAMLTTVAVFAPIAAGMGASPTIVGLAICAGACGLTLPTDGAFWLPQWFNKLSVKEIFTTITTSSTMAAVVVLIMVLILDMFSGSLPGMFF